ncbi:hypothetical protein E2C06_11505 [Dankookia rubra]|uniref:Uncharacterized protein n=1 Tax=Dankookia rubra TaxID=1442381 RepID=A0A4R5QIA2_9PROT|nr:hypothetical protein [Dankookia rubra]TDH62489.1 hypothetical protein E2C06_11505 [Dankookia rubra]
MAETSGDVVMVSTPIGGIEARRMGRAEAGPSRWQVAYPWGVETVFGTSADMASHVQRRSTQAEGKVSAEARQVPRGMARPRDS